MWVTAKDLLYHTLYPKTEFEWTNGQTNPFVVPYWQMVEDNIKKETSRAFQSVELENP